MYKDIQKRPFWKFYGTEAKSVLANKSPERNYEVPEGG